MALIADNKEFEDPEKLIMSDDGTGKSIKNLPWCVSEMT